MKIGLLAALAPRLDLHSMSQHEKFIREIKNDSCSLQKSITQEIQMLGIDPAILDIDELKEEVSRKITNALPIAEQRMEKMMKNMWEAKVAITNKNGKLSLDKEIDFAKELFLLKGEIDIETECIMSDIIHKLFVKEAHGAGFQIGRFVELYRCYDEKARDLLRTGYLKSFTEKLDFTFEVFEELCELFGECVSCNHFYVQ